MVYIVTSCGLTRDHEPHHIGTPVPGLLGGQSCQGKAADESAIAAEVARWLPSKSEPTGYYAGVAHTLDALPELFRTEYQRRGISLREVSRQTGIANPVLSQFQNRRHSIGTDHAITILRWLATPTESETP